MRLDNDLVFAINTTANVAVTATFQFDPGGTRTFSEIMRAPTTYAAGESFTKEIAEATEIVF